MPAMLRGCCHVSPTDCAKGVSPTVQSDARESTDTCPPSRSRVQQGEKVGRKSHVVSLFLINHAHLRRYPRCTMLRSSVNQATCNMTGRAWVRSHALVHWSLRTIILDSVTLMIRLRSCRIGRFGQTVTRPRPMIDESFHRCSNTRRTCHLASCASYVRPAKLVNPGQCPLRTCFTCHPVIVRVRCKAHSGTASRASRARRAEKSTGTFTRAFQHYCDPSVPSTPIRAHMAPAPYLCTSVPLCLCSLRSSRSSRSSCAQFCVPLLHHCVPQYTDDWALGQS